MTELQEFAMQTGRTEKSVMRKWDALMRAPCRQPRAKGPGKPGAPKKNGVTLAGAPRPASDRASPLP